jgi:hypothetical protein
MSMGVKFFGECHHAEGAEVDSVEAFGQAWRCGLRWGDVLMSVRVFSSRRPGELVSEARTHNGFEAAKALRPAVGLVELVVRRRIVTRADEAACRITAMAVGRFTRSVLRNYRVVQRREAAATKIATYWRRWCAIYDVETLRCCTLAATHVQAAWRRCEAMLLRTERIFALTHVQQATRAWLRRRGRRHRRGGNLAPALASHCHRGIKSATKCRNRHLDLPIRAPPCLDLLAEDDEHHEEETW